MYLNEATKDLDWKEFIIEMVKEVIDQMENGKNSIIAKIQVPTGATILSAVWQMKRKRDINTRDIKKWKAHLKIDGSMVRFTTIRHMHRLILGTQYDCYCHYHWYTSGKMYS